MSSKSNIATAVDTPAPSLFDQLGSDNKPNMISATRDGFPVHAPSAPKTGITRKCYKCGRILPLEAFVRDKNSPLGRAYKCNECNRKCAKAYADAHRDRYRKHSRDHYAAKRERYSELHKAWFKRHPGAAKAHEAVRKALETGHLLYADSCEHCGATEDLKLHHADYDRPLNVICLCRSCHQELHGRLARLEATA